MPSTHICRLQSTDSAALLTLWERSVRATHHFLDEADVVFYRPLVADMLSKGTLDLWVLTNHKDAPLGFIGLAPNAIEALFMDPAYRGQGYGRLLVAHAQERVGGALAVDVNEQNAAARGFYEALGFVVVGRSPLDDTGRPHPLLHLRREAPWTDRSIRALECGWAVRNAVCTVRLDLRVAYRQCGDGPPLVLLHGGMEDSRSWSHQLNGLSDEFRVLAWDAPGCGKSIDVPESWRLPDFADALAAWLRVLDVEQAHVLGLSWGSSVALEFYRRYSDMPASLILASAYAGWAGSLPPEEVAARHASVLAAADLPREELLKGWRGLFSSAASLELVNEVLNIAADNSGSVHPGGYRAIAHSMAEANLRDVLPGIRVPTLLLYGELDERSPLRVAEDLRTQIPAAALAVIPGVGHLANVEAPGPFNSHVRRFIRGMAHTDR